MNQEDKFVSNFRLRVQKSVVTHVRRRIVGEGEIAVKTGQIIEPQDILGEDIVDAGFSSINLARLLKVPPSHVGRFLERPVGSKFYQGELVALKKGFLGLGEQVVTSPTDCVAEELNLVTGELRLKLLPKKHKIFAGMFGVVDAVSSSGEIVIRTQATEIFGLFGSGIQRFGELIILGDKASLTTKLQIKNLHAGMILVSGALILGAALREAVGMDAAGVIIGGINARDAKAICGETRPGMQKDTDMGTSLVVTEGFGPLPIGEDIFDILKEHEGRLCLISGNSAKVILPSIDADSIMNLRKVALPLADKDRKPTLKKGAEVSVGSRVRMIWPPFMGYTGKIVAVDSLPTTLPSGVSTYLVTVEMSFKKIKIPINNIELI